MRQPLNLTPAAKGEHGVLRSRYGSMGINLIKQMEREVENSGGQQRNNGTN